MGSMYISIIFLNETISRTIHDGYVFNHLLICIGLTGVWTSNTAGRRSLSSTWPSTPGRVLRRQTPARTPSKPSSSSTRSSGNNGRSRFYSCLKNLKQNNRVTDTNQKSLGGNLTDSLRK